LDTFLRRDLYLSHASHKDLSIPCEKVAITNLVPWWEKSVQELPFHIFPVHQALIWLRLQPNFFFSN